jgi:signal transduction histidine kinase
LIREIRSMTDEDLRIRRPSKGDRSLPLWAWVIAGGSIGLFDFGLLIALDANLVVLGRDVTIPMLFAFLIPYGLLGWAFGGLVSARKQADLDRETIAKQLAELERTQRALVQEEKLAGIGRLAAGIAHEVRNPLGVIRASASMARESFESHTDPHRALGFVCDETDRLDRLIGSLLTFAKPLPIECIEADISKIIDRASELARGEAREHAIAIEVEVAAGLPTLFVDPDRLSQAIYGLTLNAIQAIADDASNADRNEPIRIIAIADDDLLRIEVSDSGPGVPETMLDQIFEPFVTTKDSGTGLGLPMALRMIEAQGGALSLVQTTLYEDRGACFRIEFPIANQHDPGGAF